MGIESMESLDELARLADTAGAEVVGQTCRRSWDDAIYRRERLDGYAGSISC